MSKRFIISCLTSIFYLVTISETMADVVLVTDLSSLSANDSLDWSHLGPDGSVLSSSAQASSDHGLQTLVTTDDASGLLRMDEGPSWFGDFRIGDHLLNNNSYDRYPIHVEFSSPITGVGTQIQPDLGTGETFTASIQAFSGSTSLGTFRENGVVNGREDGTAMSIGILSDTQNITSIILNIETSSSEFPGDFAFNSLRINNQNQSVPEPAGIVLLITGMVAIAGYTWNRRRKPVGR